ncbi:cohesin domain-containing protein [Paenibacillus doosanensis]|uniref:cohesin domain-containing protein n=1 Tax=Paenibacillus doosanensis TaxID=1229154 RepID=UPI0021802263|nr:cohesin domain-containing protein [Paenibacillus doosanensis]
MRIRGLLSVLMVTAMCLAMLPLPAAAVTADEVEVDYAVDNGASRQIASGFLHGISGEKPSQYLIDGIKVNAIRGADHHPNLPSLFDEKTYNRVKATDAKLMVGLYYYTSRAGNTYWPGDNGDWKTWESVVESVYKESVTKGYDVYSWIPWNEPRLQWSGPDRNINRYLEAHNVASHKMKALNPSAKIQAPEDDSYNFDFLKKFLTYCKEQGCLPDILSWHELSGGALDIEAHTAEIKNWMLASGITPMPIAITEYQGCCTYNNINGWESGMAVSYIARLERSAKNGLLYGLKSAWDYVGDDPKFMASLGDLADRNSSTLPKGIWWVYNAYKDMTGRLVKAESSNKNNIEVLASHDPAMNRSVVLIGSENWREPAEITLHLNHLSNASYLIRNGKLHLKAEMIPTAEVLMSPYTMLEGDYTVANGSLTVKLPPLLPKAAYRIYITSDTSEAPSLHEEAESLKAQGTPGRVYRTYNESAASGGAAAILESTSIGDSVTYTIPVPSAGIYHMKARVKSEATRGIFQLYVDGKAYGGPKDTYGPFDYYDVDFGNVPIQGNSAKLDFKVVGKNSYSSNYFMAFDSFELARLGELGLQPPEGLTASSGDAQTRLTWNPLNGADSYNLYRGSSAEGPFTRIAEQVKQTEFTDVGLTNGTAYYYVATAVNSSGESDYSAPVKSVPQGAPLLSIQLANIPAQLRVGDTVSSVVYATYSETDMRPVTDGVIFSSSDKNIADIDGKGTIRAISPGEAIITAAFGGMQATSALTVMPVESSSPQAVLNGTDAITAGTEFTTGYQLKHGQNIYAQDLTFTYDPNQLEFISAESVRKGTVIVDQAEKSGQVRMLVASPGDPASEADGDQLILHWKARAVSASQIAMITLSKAIVADKTGHEIQVAAVSHSVQIGVVDKETLLALITDAQNKLNAASEGTQPGQYPAGSKAALQSAIDKARAVAERPQATPTEVQQAVNDLTAAVQTFMNSVIVLQGDLNGDGKYTIGDLAIAAAFYGKTSADANWDLYKKADINHDNKIDIADLAVIAASMTLDH